jgi:gluconate 2-dehydrogenase gamma chain
LASLRDTYSFGLTAIDDLAKASKGAPFIRLSAADQDALLSDLQNNAARAFPGSSVFFELVRAHTIQGTFSDPYHGGNANFVGWDLIEYPGVRTAATPDDQRMDVFSAPNHKSAYDYPMFTKRSAGG